MSDVMTSPPNTQPIDVWRFPTMNESKNTAAFAADEHRQHQYVDFLAAPDFDLQAVETGAPTPPIRESANVVNDYETVLPVEQEVLYDANSASEAVGPADAKKEVLQATADAIAYATSRVKRSTPEYAHAPVAVAPPVAAPVNETVPTAQERHSNHNAAVKQAAVYAGGIIAMRDNALLKWGVEVEE